MSLSPFDSTGPLKAVYCKTELRPCDKPWCHCPPTEEESTATPALPKAAQGCLTIQGTAGKGKLGWGTITSPR